MAVLAGVHQLYADGEVVAVPGKAACDQRLDGKFVGDFLGADGGAFVAKGGGPGDDLEIGQDGETVHNALGDTVAKVVHRRVIVGKGRNGYGANVVRRGTPEVERGENGEHCNQSDGCDCDPESCTRFLLVRYYFAGGVAARLSITLQAFEIGSELDSRLVANVRVFLQGLIEDLLELGVCRD
jgi:hypothetical protein